MTAQVSLNPMVTSNAVGLFSTNSQGFTQGDAVDDPAVKFALAGGVLSTSATSPVWGGVPIIESIPTGQTGALGQVQPGTDSLGGTVIQATTSAVPTGICVYNQAFGGITTPQSNAPLYSPGMSVNFYRFGSGARIPMACDASVVALDGSSIVETVYYNYSTNLLTTTQPSGQAALPVKILRTSVSGNKLVSYDGTNANWTSTGNIALVQI